MQSQHQPSPQWLSLLCVIVSFSRFSKTKIELPSYRISARTETKTAFKHQSKIRLNITSWILCCKSYQVWDTIWLRKYHKRANKSKVKGFLGSTLIILFAPKYLIINHIICFKTNTQRSTERQDTSCIHIVTFNMQ